MDGTTDVANTAQPSIKSRGLRFPKAAFMTPTMRTALRKDTYENTLVTACNRTALPEDTVLDIGAGIGAVSATLAKQQNVKMVHAVEANPELATYLTNMFALNGIENASVISGTLGKRKAPLISTCARTLPCPRWSRATTARRARSKRSRCKTPGP